MGRARTRLAQIEETSGLTPATGVGGSLTAVIGTSVAGSMWGWSGLAVAFSVLAIMVALVAWSNLAHLHREHRALLQVVTDLTALVVPATESDRPDSKAQAGVAKAPASDATAAEEAPALCALNESDQPPADPKPDEIGSPVTGEASERSTSPSIVAGTESFSDPAEDAAGAASSHEVAQRVTEPRPAEEQTLTGGSLSSQDNADLPRLADMLPPSPLQVMLSDHLGPSGTRTASSADAAPRALAVAVTTENHDQAVGATVSEGARVSREHSEPTEAVTADEGTNLAEPPNNEMQDDAGDPSSQIWSSEPGTDDECHPAEATAVPTPSFTLPTLDGRIVNQTAFNGRPTILVFWRPDCPHSQALTPELVALQSEIGDNGPRLVIVATCDGETAEWHGLNSTTLLDPTFSLGQSLGIAGTPAAILLGPEGTPFGQIALGAAAVLSMSHASCRAWATLTSERQISETLGSRDEQSEALADTTTRIDLGPNPFERLAAEITPLHSVIVRRPASPPRLLDELDAECETDQALHRRAG